MRNTELSKVMESSQILTVRPLAFNISMAVFGSLNDC